MDTSLAGIMLIFDYAFCLSMPYFVVLELSIVCKSGKLKGCRFFFDENFRVRKIEQREVSSR